MKMIAVLALTFAVSACSTLSPVCALPESTGPDAARVVIYRPAAVVGAAYSTPMSIDNCQARDMKNGSHVLYSLSPGQHTIAVEKRALEFGMGAKVEQSFEPGKTYFFKQSVGMTAGLASVSSQQALSDMPELKQYAP